MSSNLFEDTEARRVARSTFDRPVVLRAGAGTGKTAALVARVISWMTPKYTVSCTASTICLRFMR